MKNQFDIHNFNYISSIFLGIVFLFLNLYKNNHTLLITFLIVSFITYSFNKSKKGTERITDSILYSIVISFIIYNFSKINNKSLNEGFSSSQKKGDEDSESSDKNDDDDDSEENKVVKKKTSEKSKNDDDDDDDDDDDEPYIDAGSTFLKAYKKLDQKQIEGMTKDTKELISTQKNLMETLKTLGPVVTEGKKVLDTFTNYFDK
jgi:hypothetical protein